MTPIIILCILWVGIIFLLIRNNKVYKFRTRLFYKLLKYGDRRIAEGDFTSYYKMVSIFMYRYSYERMVFSFRPLKLESWFTEDEIKELNR